MHATYGKREEEEPLWRTTPIIQSIGTMLDPFLDVLQHKRSFPNKLSPKDTCIWTMSEKSKPMENAVDSNVIILNWAFVNTTHTVLAGKLDHRCVLSSPWEFRSIRKNCFVSAKTIDNFNWHSMLSKIERKTRGGIMPKLLGTDEGNELRIKKHRHMHKDNQNNWRENEWLH